MFKTIFPITIASLAAFTSAAPFIDPNGTNGTHRHRRPPHSGGKCSLILRVVLALLNLAQRVGVVVELVLHPAELVVHLVEQAAHLLEFVVHLVELAAPLCVKI